MPGVATSSLSFDFVRSLLPEWRSTFYNLGECVLTPQGKGYTSDAIALCEFGKYV